MFRIHFDPKLGRFLIQINVRHMFWRSVMTLNQDSSGSEVMMFKTFDEASAYVKSIGLDKLYRDRSENKFREYMGQRGYTRATDEEGRVIEYREFGRRSPEHAC